MTPFEFRRISHEDPLLNEVYKLRYKVYCDEWGFERPEDHPGGLEYDAFDEHAVHLVALLKESGTLIGTIRIILDSPLGFPIEQHCVIGKDLTGLGRAHIGEISRLAVSKDYRRRASDRLIYDGGESAYALESPQLVKERRKTEYAIITGLYTCMYKESLAIGLTHWFAVMAKGLEILLKRLGISFEAVGPEVDYHGKRTPYIGAINKIAIDVYNENAQFFEAYEKGGIIK